MDKTHAFLGVIIIALGVLIWQVSILGNQLSTVSANTDSISTSAYSSAGYDEHNANDLDIIAGQPR